jgi:hypothetical protein
MRSGRRDIDQGEVQHHALIAQSQRQEWDHAGGVVTMPAMDGLSAVFKRHLC